MADNNDGSETADDIVITSPADIAKLDDDSEETDTPAAPSAEVEKPAENSEGDTEDDGSEEDDKSDEESKPKDDSTDDGDKSQDLSTGQEPKGPKPVQGETPKEYALRQELQRKREQLRKLRGAKLLEGIQPQRVATTQELSDEDRRILDGFDPEQVANQEKLFDIIAKKKGFVRKDELTQGQYKETAQTVLDDWMEKHQEYSEDKDPEGILWKRFQEEFSMYRPPANPKDHTKIFNRIHNDIFGITTKDKAEKDFRKAEAQAEKVKTASTGSSASAPRKLSDRRAASSANQELTQLARSGGLKGYSDAELAEMGL